MKSALRSATAHAHGAVTLLNATATGHGCALPVHGGVAAEWEWTDGDTLNWQATAVDDRLARAVHSLLRDRLNAPAGAHASTRTDIPAGRGLKTSSSAAAALVQAGARALGNELPEEVVVDWAVEASVAAGVTITGAYDDQVAVSTGRCHLTHNAERRILHTVPVPDLHVAIWVPGASIAKADVARVDPASIRAELEAAEAVLRSGDLAGAMTANGAAYTRLYQAAGLPVTDQPAHVALQHGALGAGLSGTGPAVAALFAAPVPLPAVPGGNWIWTRTLTSGAGP